MPFTFSHPAIILPLRVLPKHWFSLTGLVIGTLTPDFEYFFRMNIKSIYSHTIPGLFWFDLPVGLVLCFLFHNIVRNQLFNHLPANIYSRINLFLKFNWNEYIKKYWFVVCVSILIGAASHLFWDSFTHATGYFANKISTLQQRVNLFGFEVKITKILQHTSTVIGGLAIAYAVWQLPKSNTVEQEKMKNYWSMISIISLLIIVFRFLIGFEYQELGNVVMTCISAVLLALVIVPLAYRSETNMR